MKTRRKFTKEFKLRAIGLSKERPTIQEVAIELGIDSNMLYRWRKEYNSKEKPAFIGIGKSNRTVEQQEIYELKKKLRDAEMERDILKKAVSIFSKSDRSVIHL